MQLVLALACEWLRAEVAAHHNHADICLVSTERYFAKGPEPEAFIEVLRTGIGLQNIEPDQALIAFSG